jgi:hypothetical protein
MTTQWHTARPSSDTVGDDERGQARELLDAGCVTPTSLGLPPKRARRP